MTAVDLSGAKTFLQQEIARQMKHQQAVNESFQIASMCVMISTQRDKMCGPLGSEISADIVDEADRILLTFLKGLTPKMAPEDENGSD